MQLSKRLLAVSDMVTASGCLADVGTDHGYIPLYLVETGKIKRAIAMDVKEGPLMRAREHIRQKGLEEVIDTRLGDGVAALKPGEADSVVIAGMGGGLIKKILKEGENLFSQIPECILQPQSEIGQVRLFLLEEGYRIVRENMILEDGKYYPMMRVVHGSMERIDPIELKYGPCLIREKHPCLALFLEREEAVCRRIKEQLDRFGGEAAEGRKKEVLAELRQIREAKERMA